MYNMMMVQKIKGIEIIEEKFLLKRKSEMPKMSSVYADQKPA